jgi:predicted ATPase with chaperone activity
MNPCPCGYHGAPSGQGENRRECNCVSQLIQKYRAKISGPLLDRIDIHFTVPAVENEKLAEARQGESSKNIRKRVVRARQVQEQRFRNSSSKNNSGINRKELETHAELADSTGLTYARRGQISRRIPGIQVRYNKSCPQAYLLSGSRIKSYADKKILAQ